MMTLWFDFHSSQSSIEYTLSADEAILQSIYTLTLSIVTALLLGKLLRDYINNRNNNNNTNTSNNTIQQCNHQQLIDALLLQRDELLEELKQTQLTNTVLLTTASANNTNTTTDSKTANNSNPLSRSISPALKRVNQLISQYPLIYNNNNSNNNGAGIEPALIQRTAAAVGLSIMHLDQEDDNELSSIAESVESNSNTNNTANNSLLHTLIELESANIEFISTKQLINTIGLIYSDIDNDQLRIELESVEITNPKSIEILIQQHNELKSPRAASTVIELDLNHSIDNNDTINNDQLSVKHSNNNNNIKRKSKSGQALILNNESQSMDSSMDTVELAGTASPRIILTSSTIDNTEMYNSDIVTMIDSTPTNKSNTNSSNSSNNKQLVDNRRNSLHRYQESKTDNTAQLELQAALNRARNKLNTLSTVPTNKSTDTNNTSDSDKLTTVRELVLLYEELAKSIPAAFNTNNNTDSRRTSITSPNKSPSTTLSPNTSNTQSQLLTSTLSRLNEMQSSMIALIETQQTELIQQKQQIQLLSTVNTTATAIGRIESSIDTAKSIQSNQSILSNSNTNTNELQQLIFSLTNEKSVLLNQIEQLKTELQQVKQQQQQSKKSNKK